eukprot:CAMPEP_0172427978 /NCGR_PEP_ID=MMETSP1064-20121228/44377_1 /TAXON_ID=202472 /ORGANISM="Aulacoseira subarctica , Strain CCAP 1002/5" /LENGTH=32 /DNA_ID= /DNA_START= /DNA_END= /DNA_ORIENTATION=
MAENTAYQQCSQAANATMASITECVSNSLQSG